MSKINYGLNKIKAVVFDVDGVLSPTTVPLSADGIPQRMANLKDGYAMVQAVKGGLHLAIISGGNDRRVEERFKLIGMSDIFMNCKAKLPILKDWMARNGYAPEEVAYVGDDIPDLPPMSGVGLSVAPRDGAAEVKAAAVYVTTADGGYGVARELLEEILKVKGLWMVDTHAYGW